MPITTTAACVLGLLLMGPAPGQPGFGAVDADGGMTGGQVHAAAGRSVGRFFNLTRSQVYAELPRLERAGLIEPAGAPGPRGAQAYRTTAAGRTAFDHWINGFVDRGPQDDLLRSPMLLAVFFGHFAEPDRLRSLLEEYRARHQRSLRLAEDMLAALGDDQSLPGDALRRRAALEALDVRWLGEVLDRVPAGERGKARRRQGGR